MSTKKIALLTLIAVAAIIGGSLIFAQNRSTSTSNTTLNPNCQFNDPDLCKFLNNWEQYRKTTDFIVSSSGVIGPEDQEKAGKTRESILEAQGGNKMHALEFETGQEVGNLIIIDQILYTKDYATNSWSKDPTGVEEALHNFTLDTLGFSFTDAQGNLDPNAQFKQVLKEPCGQLTCFQYQVLSPRFDETTPQFIWFDETEYKLRKSRAVDPEAGDADRTYRYETITISEPSPLKQP